MLLQIGWALIITLHVLFGDVHAGDFRGGLYFRAHLTNGSTVGVGSNVRFDQVDLQIGNGYNPTSGVFTAPVSGIYQFMVHVQSIEDGVSSYYLVNQGKFEIHTSIHHIWDAVSFNTILHVRQGHHVSVRKTYASVNAKLFSSTQFAGYLLRQY